LGFFFAIAHAQSISSESPNQKICPQNLSLVIDEVINRPELSSSYWGIEIKTLNSQHILYSLNSNKYFIPASTTKLLTTAALLTELGRDYRIVTPIYGVGVAPNLTSLRIEGRGDPSLSTKNLKNIVHQLQQKKVTQIEKLIVDEGYFSRSQINPTWEWSDIYNYYATSVNSLILNQNMVTLTLLPQQLGQPVKLQWSSAIAARQWKVINNAITASKDTPYDIEIEGILAEPTLNIRGELAINEKPDIWDLAIVNPPNYFLESWRYLLEVEGIKVTRGETTQTQTNYSNESENKITDILSPKLSELITVINQESNNLYAESLSRILSKETNTKNNIEAINKSLEKLGINSKDYILVDASGLSRHNLVTPEVLIKVLEVMAKRTDAKVYRNSLAIAGKKGTLSQRFKNTAIEGNLQAKTGTLTGVATLAGYINPRQYETLILTILINNSTSSSQELRNAIDEIITILSKVQKCFN
jgi:D-alanyl-D-alanine carboxypeptidase/D-alanyl-D-alanine-endopeptidase (penicillin-binding protein 4)